VPCFLQTQKRAEIIPIDLKTNILNHEPDPDNAGVGIGVMEV
jgi:hypothetical protein